MKKILFLTYSHNDMILGKFRQENIDVKRMFRLGKHTTKLFRIIPILKKVRFLKLFCDKWIEEVNGRKYSTIILNAETIAPFMVELLKSIDKDLRIIVYYWNCCAVEVSPLKFNRDLCELWTFDKNDAKEYGLKYNPQLWTTDYEEILKKSKNEKVEWDVYFVGNDKGRKTEVLEVGKIIQDLGYSALLLIMRGQTNTQKNFKNLKKLKKESYEKRITYEENLVNVMKSRAILDICVEGQEGLTLRAMESLYLKKKLITNNKAIKEEPFYNKNNVFIIGEDKWNLFDYFMEQAWEEQKEEVLTYYTGDEWIKRFAIEL